jgi:hypothetical protein
MDKTLDLDELERVAREATQGPWELQDGCSWRRIGTRNGNGDVLCPYNSRTDNHPDLCAGRGEDVYANLRHMTTFDPPTILTLIAAARPAETRDWSEFEDDIADAISDSMDMDWSSRDGARAVVAYLKQIGAKLP